MIYCLCLQSLLKEESLSPKVRRARLTFIKICPARKKMHMVTCNILSYSPSLNDGLHKFFSFVDNDVS